MIFFFPLSFSDSDHNVMLFFLLFVLFYYLFLFCFICTFGKLRPKHIVWMLAYLSDKDSVSDSVSEKGFSWPEPSCCKATMLTTAPDHSML